jgi:excisionase family DNA binding protein
MGRPQPRREGLSDGALLLTPEEAARVLSIGRTTIFALIKAGELRPVRIGRSCRLSRIELERYVDRLQAPPPARPRGRRPTGADQTGLFELRPAVDAP